MGQTGDERTPEEGTRRWWRRGSHALDRLPVTVMVLAAAGGFLFVTAAVNADDGDLRPAGGDVASLLEARGAQVEGRQEEARSLRDQINRLSEGTPGSVIDRIQTSIEQLEPRTGLTKVSGEGVRVVLTDAPDEADKPGIDPNLLVVHEQDIQAFVNALWAGGAKAISLQGQRLIGTTGIKCVGNTVLLDGVPYSPPYRIEAIGDSADLIDSMRNSPATLTYASYSKRLKLGLKVENLFDLTIPAYGGTVDLRHARVVDRPS